MEKSLNIAKTDQEKEEDLLEYIIVRIVRTGF